MKGKTWSCFWNSYQIQWWLSFFFWCVLTPNVTPFPCYVKVIGRWHQTSVWCLSLIGWQIDLKNMPCSSASTLPDLFLPDNSCLPECVFSPVPFSWFPSLRGSIHAKSVLSPFPISCLSVLPAFNPWFETAGVTLLGGRVQSEKTNLIQKGEAGKIVGNVYFEIGSKIFFSPNHTWVFAYKWQPSGCQEKRGSWGERDKWRWSVMTVKCRRDAERWSCFIC